MCIAANYALTDLTLSYVHKFKYLLYVEELAKYWILANGKCVIITV